MNRRIFLLCFIVFLTACEKAETPPLPPRPALVMKADGSDELHTSMVLVGEVRSRYTSNQGFRIQGKIISRSAEVGDLVKKGDELARIDPKDNQLLSNAANADVLAAKANYDLAIAEVERVRKLVKQKFMSQSALDAQESQLKTAAARLKQVEAQADISQNQSRYTTLTADRDGVITQINAEPGQVVQAGDVVAQIADINQIEVLVAVPESRITNVKQGDIVGIRLWAQQDKKYQGKVREITPAASEATRAFDMRVTVLDADEQVKLGMTAGVIFPNEGHSKVVLPSSAVTEKAGKTIVWVVSKDGIANPREVTITPFSENGVGVTSGLEPDELVAVAGVHTLVAGQKVTPQMWTREQ
ncbi:MAG: efflux RND transporter periplasmic adaptor subunit [Methylophilaceae bacterium]